HGDSTLPFMIVAVVYGVAFALVGGYVSGWIASHSPFAHGLIVAGILASGAGVSLIATLGKGAVWSQVAAVGGMGPPARLGGYIRERVVRQAKKEGQVSRSEK